MDLTGRAETTGGTPVGSFGLTGQVEVVFLIPFSSGKWGKIYPEHPVNPACPVNFFNYLTGVKKFFKAC